MVEDLGEKRATQEERLLSEASVEKLAGRLIRAEEEERARIARELQDDIYQQLVMVSINLDQLRQSLPKSTAEITQKISEAREQLGAVGNDIHALSQRLHPAKLKYLGFAAAAAGFCKELSNRQKVKIDFQCAGIATELPEEIALCLYRVLQEALQNATKHSGTGHFEVSLCGESNEIQLTVRDWGIGFDPAVVMKGRGLGLTRMKERLKLVDGELSVESQHQHGTKIHARVPLR
jgi:signal transduction histidine kinase